MGRLKHSNIQRQSGAVMIAALMIFVLVVSLSVGMGAHHQRSLMRAESRFHGNQAREYLFGAEQMGMFALDQDYKSDQENGAMVDSLDEFWAQPQTFPLDEGVMEGEIIDAQSRLDVNRLGVLADAEDEAGPTSPKRFTADQRRFIRLLQLLNEEQPMDVSAAIEILEAIVDWIDADDQEFGFGGAESLYYQRQDPPVTPANRLLTSVTELRWVKGMTPELFAALQPYITALPAGAGLNINTVDRTLLRTINVSTTLAPLPAVDGEALELERGAVGYGDVAEFLAGSVPSSLASQGDLSSEGLVVASDFFFLTAKVQVGRQRRSMLSILQRQNGVAKVIRHNDFVL
ncbi:type II secretion system minor pseudopilin GspK [Halioxenophilus aromaticivorans]|uniref:Type II secretion system protein K n=1 Tax=Halioxenophilus aromaticivorans TaxID=1306992 RepID=A0AAV3U5A6_9ALTE